MDQIIEKFIKYFEAKERSQETKNAYKINLAHFAQFLEDNGYSLLGVTKENIASYISILQKNGFKNSSINQRITTLRNLFTYLEKMEKISNPLIDTSYFKKVKTKVDLTIYDIRKIISFLETDESFDLTTRLISLFMVYFELKGSIICKLKLSDIVKENDSIFFTVQNKKIELAKQSPVLSNLFKTYLIQRQAMQIKYDELFLNHIKKPLSKVNIIYIASKIALHFKLKNRSLLILSKAMNLLKDSTLINNRFEIIENIKSDIQKDTYEVRDMEDGNKLKLLSLYKADKKIIAEFKKLKINFESCSLIYHRNLIKIFDFDLTTFKKEQHILITKEHFKLHYLSEYFGKINLDGFLELASGLMSGLNAIHRNKLALDLITPQNIIVIDDNGRLVPKFFEWGINLKIEKASGANTEYTAPETISFNQRDIKSEIYSLGMILYYLAFGKYPIKKLDSRFRGNDDSGSISDYDSEKRNIKNGSEEKIKLPTKLKEVILRMVEEDPEKRFIDLQSSINSFSPFIKTQSKEENIELSSLSIDISTELSLMKMKLDMLFDSQKESRPEYILITGDRGSGKSFLLNKLCDICDIMKIPVHRLNLNLDSTAGSLVSIFRDKKCELDMDVSARKISLLENTSQQMNLDRLTLFAIDDLHEASSEFNELLIYIIKKYHNINQKALFAFAYEKARVDNNFINSMPELNEDGSTSISIKPLSQDEISNILYFNFKKEISDEVSDYIFFKSQGTRGKVLNIVNYLLQNHCLIIDQKSKKIDFSFSFYQHGDEYSVMENNDLSATIIKIISSSSKPISKEILIKILKEFNFEILKLEQSIKALSAKGIVNYSISNKELQISNKYISTLFYSKIDNTEKKKIHNYLGNEIEKREEELSNEEVNDIANHFLKAENAEKSYFYFSKLAKEAVNNGLLGDAMVCLDKLESLVEILSESDKINYHFSRAKIFLDLYNLEEARKEADILKQIIKNPHNSIMVQYILARICLKSGNIKNGYKILDDILINKKTDELYLELLILKVSALLSLMRYNVILQNKDNFLNFKWNEKNITSKVRLMNLIALAHYYVGEFESAEILLNESLSLAENSKIKSIELKVLNNLGMVYYQRSLFKEARTYYEKALNIAENISDLLNKANILNNLGGIEQMMGNFNSALSYFLQTEEIYGKFDCIKGYENVLFGKALLFSQIGYFDKTLDILKKVNEISRKSENDLVTAYSLALLGNMERVRGNFEDSINKNDQAITLFEKHSLLKELCQVYLSKTETYLEMENIDEAEKELNRAKEIKKVNHYPDISLRIILQEISFHLRREPIQYTEVNNKFNIIQNNEILSNDWELKLKYLRLKAIYCRMLGNYDESSDTISCLKEEVKRIIGSNSQEDIKTFFLKSEFGLFLNNFETQYTKKSELERILEINLEITENLNLDLLLNKILTSIILLSKSESAFIILIDQDSKLRVKAGIDNKGENLKRALSNFREDIIKSVLLNKKPIVEQMNFALNPLQKEEKTDNTKTIIIPLSARREPIGVLYVENEVKKEVHSGINLKLLTLLASQAAIAIENARLYEFVLNSKNSLVNENKSIQSELHKRSFYLDLYERELKYNYDEIIGKSKKINNILKTIDNIVDSDITALIQGESGTGKELIARAIHFNGQRKNKPFIAENCAAFTETLLESELFGHQRGAFTDAHKDKRGIFEMADGGTVFLDEVGEMSLNMQKKFLRLLERGEVRRIGDEKTKKVNVRLISASNKSIKELIRNGSFREDLYYRLNGITITLPPLRERKEDIPYLVKYFLEKHMARSGEKFYIDEGVLDTLQNYNWPGNIRELKNEVDRLIAISEGNRIGSDLLKDDSRFS